MTSNLVLGSRASVSGTVFFGHAAGRPSWASRGVTRSRMRPLASSSAELVLGKTLALGPVSSMSVI